MNELDQALATLRDNPRDHKAQSGFYDLFLNMSFFVPTVQEQVDPEGTGEEREMDVPMIVEADGTDYLVFFDQRERLNQWADQEAACVEIPGYQLVEMSVENLYWAMNVGTEHAKQFHPEEISWLKGVVAQCKAEASKEEGAE